MMVWVWSICVLKTDEILNEKKAVFQPGIPRMRLKNTTAILPPEHSEPPLSITRWRFDMFQISYMYNYSGDIR
jgi:hypothetical protein